MDARDAEALPRPEGDGASARVDRIVDIGACRRGRPHPRPNGRRAHETAPTVASRPVSIRQGPASPLSFT